MTRGGRVADSEAQQLQASVQGFVRNFGLLVTKQTPCGQPVSPSHAHALMILLDRERLGLKTSQSDLGEQLGLDKSNVARICARLQTDDHAKQEVAPDDGRSRHLELTQQGKRLATNIHAASLERFRRVVSAIPPGKRKALLESLELLRTAVGTLEE